MRLLAFCTMLTIGCTREAPSSGGDPGTLTTPAAGGLAGMNGDTGAGGGGNPGGSGGGGGSSTPLPALDSGNYSAVSGGLTANDCQTTPLGSDLGTWAVKVVNPTVWNVTVDPELPIAVLDLSGAFFVGQTGDQAMPIYGCMMSETWHVRLTPTSTTTADGSTEMVLDKVSGDCSQYEPVLPCTTAYQVALTKM